MNPLCRWCGNKIRLVNGRWHDQHQDMSDTCPSWDNPDPHHEPMFQAQTSYDVPADLSPEAVADWLDG